MKKEGMLSSFDATELYYCIDTPEEVKGVAVIVHGLCEHQGRYDYLVQKFNEAGMKTYRFDHRGHGRSKGERTYFATFDEMVDDTDVLVEKAIKENPGLPVFLLGHSMGGYCASLYGAKYPGKLRGIVLSGALSRDNRRLISDLPRDLDPHALLPNELGSGVCSVKEVVEWYGQDPYNTKTFTPGLCYALIDGIGWLAKHAKSFVYPVFMMHGEKDGLVSVRDSYDFFDMVESKDKQLKVYGGLYHEIFNEYCKDEVIMDAVRWMLNRC